MEGLTCGRQDDEWSSGSIRSDGSAVVGVRCRSQPAASLAPLQLPLSLE